MKKQMRRIVFYLIITLVIFSTNSYVFAGGEDIFPSRNSYGYETSGLILSYDLSDNNANGFLLHIATAYVCELIVSVGEYGTTLNATRTSYETLGQYSDSGMVMVGGYQDMATELPNKLFYTWNVIIPYGYEGEKISIRATLCACGFDCLFCM